MCNYPLGTQVERQFYDQPKIATGNFDKQE
jgi:hypothetical protein